MSRETLRRAVVQKFNDALKSSYTDFEELKVEIDRTKEGREKANEIINSLKVCDPAVGSGHFLVSVLNEIITIKSELGLLCYRDGSRVQNYSVEIHNDELIITDVESEDIFKYHLNQKGNVIDGLQRMQETVFHEKQTIIENCLFGVDINPNSVNICRLRLWIELLKNSYYTKDSGYKELETLPNIDINIKQGNSLISRFELGDQVFTKGDRTSLELYKMNVKLYKNATDRDERKKLKDSIDRIRERIKGIYIDPLSDEKKKLRNLQGELEKMQSQISGFEDEKLEEKKEKLEKKIDKEAKEINKQEKENELIFRDAFEWRFEFPEVLDEDGNFEGFDVVIGNPPYMKLQDIRKISPSAAKYYSLNYDFAKKGNFDIYLPFIELNLKLTKNETGYIDIIAPSLWMFSEYGESLRNYLRENKNLLRMLNFGSSQVFEDAITYTACQLFSKTKNNMIFYTQLDKPEINEEISYSLIDYNNIQESWSLQPEEKVKIKNLMEQNGTPLGEIANIFVGVQTSADIVFQLTKTNDNYFSKSLNKEVKLEEDLLQPIISGGSVRRYLVDDNYKFLLHPYSLLKPYRIIPLEKIQKDYKNIYSYLKQNEKLLRLRENNKMNNDSWYGYIYLKNFSKQQLPKLCVAETVKNLEVCFDSEGRYFLNNVRVNGVTLKNNKISFLYLLALLNSQLLNFYFKLIAKPKQNEYYEANKQYIEKLPIVVKKNTQVNRIEFLADQILTSKKENPEADTSALEREIDELVYKLYGLKEEEIKIVEGN
jgi:hypothetical protein